MTLKHSYANRAGGTDNGRFELELGCFPAGGLPGAIHFDFNMGSPAKKELVRLSVEAKDFSEIAQAMLEVDEKAAVKAFARAIQRMPYLSKKT